MTERVRSHQPDPDWPLAWDSETPEAFLTADDEGRAALAVWPHEDDDDDRCVVLRFRGVSHASMGSPEDDLRHHHRLFTCGLRDVEWLGVVHDSELVAGLSVLWHPSAPKPTHYVAVTPQSVVEVVADSLEVVRYRGSTSEAAIGALSGE